VKEQDAVSFQNIYFYKVEIKVSIGFIKETQL